MDAKTLESLIKVWELNAELENKGEYVSQEDFDSLKEINYNDKKRKLSLSDYYATHLVPQPWWGNIKNPEIIVLTLNPSYDIGGHKSNNKMIEGDDYDELRNESDFKKKERENLKGNTINFFEFNNDLDGYVNATYDWWANKVFKGFDLKEKTNRDEVYQKFGFFQLCGYRSISFTQPSRRAYSQNYLRKFGEQSKIYLPTQKALKNHLKVIIEKYVKYVIIIWGEKNWEEFLGKEIIKLFNDKKVLIVNKGKNSREKIIKKALNIDEEIKNELMKFGLDD